MLNIQLFLEDQEVELNEKVSFPLNRSFENLNDPTSILVEYSKTISLPITKRNNKIFGNIYRLDRTIVGGGQDGDMGFFFDPTKRISAKLIYNGKLILDGYAKFTSSNYSVKDKSYNINLYGKLGDIFNELKSVVVNENTLGDLDRRYLIEDTDCYDGAYSNKLNKTFVRSSFDWEDNRCWDQNRDDEYNILDVFGFAPTHRGLYSDFNSTKIQDNVNGIREIADYLKEKWGGSIEATDVVGDGFKDYEMRELRAYKMKPYMYFNQLMKVFANKCKSISGYEFELDRDWFNINNPYWSKMCYTFDFLDTTTTPKGQGVKSFLLDGDGVTTYQSDYYDKGSRQCGLIMDNITVDTTTNAGDSGCVFTPFDIYFGCSIVAPTTNGRYVMSTVSILPETNVFFELTITRKIGWDKEEKIGTIKYWTNGAGDSSMTPTQPGYDENNFLPLQGGGAGGGILMSTRASMQTLDGYVRYYVTVPQLAVSGDLSDGIEVSLTVIMENQNGFPENASSDMTGYYVWRNTWVNGSVKVPNATPINQTTYNMFTDREVTFFATLGDIYQIKDWKENTEVGLSTFYKKDTPLFDVILEYTKMFGLHWDVDYTNKKVKILTRNNIFKDYTIENWDGKIDRNKNFIIEPVLFHDKKIVFNYEDKDGYIYGGYKDKYGVNFGEKVLYTQYKFNNNETKLFSGIDPASSSSKSIIPFSSLVNWDTRSIINPIREQYVLMDCEGKDGSGSISLNNWYLRGDCVTSGEFIITDDSVLMSTNDTPCYYDRAFALDSGLGVEVYELPTFSVAVKYPKHLFWDSDTTYGCIFNTPNEDYTYDLSVTNMGNNNIYELFWKDYINERYNIQNKKLTAYVKLTDKEFMDFKFNKFVTISNQLFMVNKIVDYNIHTNESTKIEFVQVNDPSLLKTTSFPVLAAAVKRIYVKGSSDPSSQYYRNSDYVSGGFLVFGTPFVNNPTITGTLVNHIDEYGIDDHTNNGVYCFYSFGDLAGQYVIGNIEFENDFGDKLSVEVVLDFRDFKK